MGGVDEDSFSFSFDTLCMQIFSLPEPFLEYSMSIVLCFWELNEMTVFYIKYVSKHDSSFFYKKTVIRFVEMYLIKWKKNG